jgi:hypothetical protein
MKTVNVQIAAIVPVLELPLMPYIRIENSQNMNNSKRGKNRGLTAD